MKKLLMSTLLLGFGLSVLFPTWAAAPEVRIKDIAHILEARENQLLGFGLVVGLKNTGDSAQTGFTKLALTNLLSKMGIAPQANEFKSKNVAAVMVTADLPPFVKSGQRLAVTISSLGDALSLRGGTLLLTPMLGADEQVYAVAQGAVSVGGLYDEPNVSPIVRGQTTVGRIPDGALVEKEIPVEIGAGGFLTIVLNQPDFTTATRVVYSILKSGMEAVAKDAATITVPLFSGVDVVSLIAKMENLTVVPDVSAKVVINERTGTIVIGERVRIAPVAVTYGGFTINVGDLDYYKEESESLARGLGRTTVKTQVKVSDPKHQLVAVEGGSSLGDLIKAVNAVGASPRDLIAIIQSIKEAGALSAELEII